MLYPEFSAAKFSRLYLPYFGRSRQRKEGILLDTTGTRPQVPRSSSPQSVAIRTTLPQLLFPRVKKLNSVV
jgi:hypothetical protein